MDDPTELTRRHMVESGEPVVSSLLNDLEGGPSWDTAALTRDFEVLGFSAPFVVVRRRSDGVKGSLEFTHAPRLYFNFVVDDPERSI